jgi:hypothetical protein
MFNPQPQAQNQPNFFPAGSNMTFGPSSNIGQNQPQTYGNPQNINNLSFQKNPNLAGYEQETQTVFQNFINAIS